MGWLGILRIGARGSSVGGGITGNVEVVDTDGAAAGGATTGAGVAGGTACFVIFSRMSAYCSSAFFRINSSFVSSFCSIVASIDESPESCELIAFSMLSRRVFMFSILDKTTRAMKKRSNANAVNAMVVSEII
jgi:hypothetical protein